MNELTEIPVMEVIDYTPLLEQVVERLDNITSICGVLMNVTLFSLGVSVAIGVCYFLYKAIKQLF